MFVRILTFGVPLYCAIDIVRTKRIRIIVARGIRVPLIVVLNIWTD